MPTREAAASIVMLFFFLTMRSLQLLGTSLLALCSHVVDGGMLLRGSMQLVPFMGPLKNAPASEKMNSLAAGGNPVGIGRGRGVRLWGALMFLSLMVSRTTSRLTKNYLNIEKQSPVQDCRQCFKITLRGQVVTKTLMYHTHYDCKIGDEKGNCIYNNTQYKMC